MTQLRFYHPSKIKYDYRILHFSVICWNGSYLIDCFPLVLVFGCSSSSEDLRHSCFKLITATVFIRGVNSMIVLTPLLCSSETPP